MAGGSTITTGADFLGTGWAAPIQAAGGRVALRSDADLVAQSIGLILATAKGERVMEPEFGCDLNHLVFSPDNNAIIHLAEYAVKDALGTWEPRIDVTGVTATIDSTMPSRLLISIDYVLRSYNSQHNLVYPFNIG